MRSNGSVGFFDEAQCFAATGGGASTGAAGRHEAQRPIDAIPPGAVREGGDLLENRLDLAQITLPQPV